MSSRPTDTRSIPHIAFAFSPRDRHLTHTIENAQHIGPTPAGGLYSTVFELYRWDRALYGKRLASDKTKQLLFAPRSVVIAYGWKTVHEDWGTGKHLVLRTTGGLPGFRNLLVRIPHMRRVIILLSNVRGPVDRHDAIATAVNRLLDGLPYERPRRSIAQMLAPIARGSAAEEALARVRSRADEFELVEAEMNALGYELLSIGNGNRRHHGFPSQCRVVPAIGERVRQPRRGFHDHRRQNPRPRKLREGSSNRMRTRRRCCESCRTSAEPRRARAGSILCHYSQPRRPQRAAPLIGLTFLVPN